VRKLVAKRWKKHVAKRKLAKGKLGGRRKLAREKF
jgi:hypothetical protein